MRLLIFLLVFSICFLGAQQHSCTQNQAQRAEAEAVMLRSWDALYRSYKTYGHCDDGAIAEGYSESVARILVDHWDTLPTLADLAEKDEFRRFVIRHVDSTLDLNDLKKIRKNAKTRCPSGLGPFCADLIKNTDIAIQEDARLGIK